MNTELQELHERHSELCATAHQRGIAVPENLTKDFDTAEVGRAVCSGIEALLRENGIAEDAGSEHTDPAPSTKPKRAKSKKKAAAPAAAPQQEEEKTMTTKSKKTKAKKASKKSAKTNARKAVGKKAVTKRGDSKSAKVGALLKRAGGCTRGDILKATGWKAVSVQQIAKGLGVKLKVDESARPFRYKAA